VARLSGRFGAVRIAQVLVGSKAREVKTWGLDRIPTYGKLGEWSIDQAKETLNLLADAGLVERQTVAGGKPGTFVLALSEDGRKVMMGQARPELPLPPHEPEPRTSTEDFVAGSPEEVDENLLARLKQWRLDESRRRGVPAFVIFHDKTLSAIAASRPADREALLRIKGLGPAKLAAYGDALLEITRGH
jgi:ATP-dependent DNA helicase RecQ